MSDQDTLDLWQYRYFILAKVLEGVFHLNCGNILQGGLQELRNVSRKEPLAIVRDCQMDPKGMIKDK